MNVLAERVCKFSAFAGTTTLHVRLWLEDKWQDDKHWEDVRSACRALAMEMMEKAHEIPVIAIRLLERDGTNAVEVTDERGSGVVLYRDWP